MTASAARAVADVADALQRDELDRLRRFNAELNDAVTRVQARSNELLEEARALRRDPLYVAAAELGEDERAVLVAIAKRLAHGRRHYGPLDIRGDRRDWRGEAAEEALDLSVYMACELLRGAE